MCLPLLIFLCTIKSRSSLLAPAHLGGPGKKAVKRWCVAVCVSCFLVKKHAAFKRKAAISGFPVSPDNAEALVTVGEVGK